MDKPRHLQREYAEQFLDPSVAARYRTRPPYPTAAFDVLERLAGGTPARVLDLGCGTGEIAIPLARRGHVVDAVDASRPMLDIGEAEVRGLGEAIRWTHSRAEEFPIVGPYDLVVAAASLHWMEWDILLPRIDVSLAQHGWLALLEDSGPALAPWMPELRPLLARYSTNRDYTAFNLRDELATRDLFVEAGRAAMEAVAVSQTIDDYVASFHARNGFSYARMAADNARAFDAALRSLVTPFADAASGCVTYDFVVTVTWGRPRTDASR